MFNRLRRLPDGLAFLLLAIILLCLPIPLGSNRLWALSIIELMAFALAALCIIGWALNVIKLERPWTGVLFCALVWGAWSCWIAFQIQDLGLDEVEIWSPQRAQIQHRLIQAEISDSTERLTLSVDQGETAEHFLETLAYACLFFSVILLASGSRRRLAIILWLIMLSALAQSVYGSLMLMSGMEWGFWGAKEHYRGSATGTFVNRNHFAGYLELGIAAAIGVILCTQSNRSKPLGARQRLTTMIREWDTRVLFSRVAIALLFVGLILSQSRMGNAAALGALSISGFFYLLIRFRKTSYKALALFVSILIIDIWIVGGWFGLDELVERYEKTEISSSHRAEMWPDLKKMMRAYQWTGSGLGTFKVAYPEFHSEEVQGLNSHAHNDFAQFIIETGVIGSTVLALLVIATVFQCFRILRNRRHKTYAGVAFAGMMALFSIAIHSGADFNLQIPANAATLVVLMACVWACKPTSSPKKQQ